MMGQRHKYEFLMNTFSYLLHTGVNTPPILRYAGNR